MRKSSREQRFAEATVELPSTYDPEAVRKIVSEVIQSEKHTRVFYLLMAAFVVVLAAISFFTPFHFNLAETTFNVPNKLEYKGPISGCFIFLAGWIVHCSRPKFKLIINK